MWGSAMAHGRLIPACEKGLLSRRGGWRGGAAVLPSYQAAKVKMGAEIFETDKESVISQATPPPHTDTPQRRVSDRRKLAQNIYPEIR